MPGLSAPALYELARGERRTRRRGMAVLGGWAVVNLAAGVALQQLGARRGDPQLQGWGDALLVQGGFLLAFDLALYAAHRRWTRRLLGW